MDWMCDLSCDPLAADGARVVLTPVHLQFFRYFLWHVPIDIPTWASVAKLIIAQSVKNNISLKSRVQFAVQESLKDVAVH